MRNIYNEEITIFKNKLYLFLKKNFCKVFIRNQLKKFYNFYCKNIIFLKKYCYNLNFLIFYKNLNLNNTCIEINKIAKTKFEFIIIKKQINKLLAISSPKYLYQ